MNFFLKLFSSRKQREDEFFARICVILGYKPKQAEYFYHAFRKSQIAKTNSAEYREILNQYQRLEFLGDAILGAIAANWLFNKYPQQTEGYLTAMRSKIVSRSNLNRLAVELGIQELATKNLSAQKASKSIGGDTVEAFLGALFLSEGLDATAQYIKCNILGSADQMNALEVSVISYKGRFIEWAQQEKKSYHFELIDQKGKPHRTLFTMALYCEDELIGQAEALSKKEAKEQAAEIAMTLLAQKHE